MSKPIYWCIFLELLLRTGSCNNIPKNHNLVTETLKKHSCLVHIANFEPRSREERAQYHETMKVIEFPKLYPLVRTFTHPSKWSRRDNSNKYLTSLNFVQRLSGCRQTFLLVQPTPQQILESIEYSGYSIETSALFLVYLSEQAFNENYVMEKYAIDSGKQFYAWPKKIYLTDVTLVFLIGERSIGIFCYLCKKKNILVFDRQSFEKQKNVLKKYDEINKKDVFGAEVAIDNVWWAVNSNWGINCDPFQHRKLNQHFTCWPIGRIITSLLRQKYNFTVVVDPINVDAKLYYERPFFGIANKMVMIPGPLSRAFPRNYSKEFFFNTSLDRLFYCIDRYKASSSGISSLLQTLTQPFEEKVWILLFVSTVLIVVTLRPVDPIGMLSVIVGQSYHTLQPGKGGNVRKFLLAFWSLIISTSISFLYDGSLTANMLVPLPDAVIQTFSEMILKGFKIGYMDYSKLESAHDWYSLNFKKPGIADKVNTSFVSVPFNDQIYELVVNRSGSLAIFREENDIETAYFKIKQQVSRIGKPVKCFMVGEPIYPRTGMVQYASTFLFHMSTAFQRTMEQVLETGILKELTKINIWQESKLKKGKTGRDKSGDFQAAGFSEDSKILVIFLVFGFGIGLSTAEFIMEVTSWGVYKCTARILRY